MSILQRIIEALDLSIYSYVKPGTIHRFSLHDIDLHRYVRIVTSSLDSYINAIELGSHVAKGLLTFPTLNVGRVITRSIVTSMRWLTNSLSAEFHLIMIPSTIALSYSIIVSGQSFINTFKKAVINIMRHSGVKDSIEVYSVIKDITPFNDLMSELGITEGYIRVNSLSLYDLYSMLGKKSRSLNVLVSKLDIIISMSSRFVKIYNEVGDYNLATVATYVDGLERIYGIPLKLDISRGRVTINELYSVDREFRSKNMSFNDLIPLLCLSVLLALCSLEELQS